jgi:hypothetical protein
MRIPSAEDIRRIVLQTTQPLASGLMELAGTVTAKLSDISGFGSGDSFRLTYPYGMVAKPIKGVVSYFLHLQGKALAPVIIAHLDKKRPTPSAAGEVIFYCLNAAGTTVPVKLTLGVDGVLKVEASTKARFLVDAIELGDGTLEKILNGEAFQTWANTHTHLGNLGAPTGPPIAPSDPTHLSDTVKAAT